MDNKEDLAYLLSDDGKEKIIQCHVEGIISYINSKNNKFIWNYKINVVYLRRKS